MTWVIYNDVSSVICKVYTYRIIMLYTLSLYIFIFKLYLSKARGENVGPAENISSQARKVRREPNLYLGISLL